MVCELVAQCVGLGWVGLDVHASLGCGYVWGGCGWALTYCREESFEFGCSTGGPKTATGADPAGRLEVTELF